MIALVVAMAENGVIGTANRLPWHLPADLKHFKALTLGKPVLMGRKTFQAIGAALPGRRNLVLTRAADFSAPDVEVVSTLDGAIAASADAAELMIIGGAQVYRLCLPRAARIYLTRVHTVVAGDTRFPNCDWNEWRQAERSEHPADDKNVFAMTFLTLERV
jgi:dihydrofolate reductase